MQWELATRGIQHRVADAKAAGIHPLYALGAQTPQINPAVQTFESLGDLGQDLGRAAMANSTQPQRDYYAAKELSAMDARLKSNQVAMSDLELEAARLRLNRLQNEVTAQAQGYEVEPNRITAADPVLPSVAAGPAGPGFKSTRIGDSTWDIGSSELSEWAEGAGLVGHGLVPFWMYQQATARRLREQDAMHEAAKNDPAYQAALAHARRVGGYVKRGRHNGVWGWQVVERDSWPRFNQQERRYWRDHFTGRRGGGASGSW